MDGYGDQTWRAVRAPRPKKKKPLSKLMREREAEAREARLSQLEKSHEVGGEGWIRALEWASRVWQQGNRSEDALEEAAYGIGWEKSLEELKQQLLKIQGC
jgi:hypothetical protein